MDEFSWTVFGLVVQDKTPLPIVAEKLDITINDVKRIVAGIKKDHPDLFYVDTEHQHLSNKICGQERKKLGIGMVSYESRKDATDDIDEEIKQKF